MKSPCLATINSYAILLKCDPNVPTKASQSLRRNKSVKVASLTACWGMLCVSCSSGNCVHLLGIRVSRPCSLRCTYLYLLQVLHVCVYVLYRACAYACMLYCFTTTLRSTSPMASRCSMCMRESKSPRRSISIHM